MSTPEGRRVSLLIVTLAARTLPRRLGSLLETNQEISAQLETQPRRGHAGRHLEQVWDNALVEAFDAFLGDDDTDGVRDGLVLVTHSRHGVDLEPAT